MLLGEILNKLGLGEISIYNESDTRRRYPRHPGLHAEVSVNDATYSVQDWSLGGLFFETPPDSRMIVGDKVTMDLKFRLPHETITIPQTATVVRAAKKGIAAEFIEMPPDVRRKFDRVLDNFHAQSFIESQVA